jgi:diguanylate cyclase (GGDEF)-like protein/PAS domain S-box-containing protein
MTRALRILIVEDSDDDAVLTLRALRSAFAVTYERVENAEAMRRALHDQAWDIVLSDHKLPEFDSFGALRVLQESGRDLPFIIVSGTIGEEVAVAAMKAGAHDYLLKGHLQRLVPAIERELNDAELRRAGRQAQEMLIKLSQAVEQTADTMFITDLDGRIEYVNPAFEKVTGYSAADAIGKTPRILKSGRHDQKFYQRLWQIIQAGKVYQEILVNKKKNAELYFEEITITPLTSAEGRITHFISTGKDITERERALEDLRESEQRFHGTFDQAAVGIAHVALDGHWLRVNQKLCEIIGYPEHELLQLTFLQVTYPEDKGLEQESIRQLLANEIWHFSLEKRYVRKDGDVIWINLTVSLVRDDLGAPKYFISVIEDVTRRKEAEAQLVYLANHDALTGLANRTLLQDRLSQSIAVANRSGHAVAVLFIDMDRFKNINDSLGHDIGDRFLLAIAQRLADTVRAGDTVARLGGDEFVIVLGELRRPEYAATVATQVLAAVSRPLLMEGHELTLSSSIGISLYPKDGLDVHTILKNADAALNRAKNAGRNSYQFYASEMNAHALERLTLENDLHYALKRNEFRLYYQPQVDAVSGEIVGVEALLRWQPQGGKVLPPSRFLPLLEESGLILPVGEWVLRTACTQACAWARQVMPVRVAVNISGIQCQRQNLVELVARVLRDTNCNAEWLEIEVTESVLMKDADQTTEILLSLKQMGVHLAIDDFGTGYSSLNYLKRFPIDTLKIDQSFVRDITIDPGDALIAKAVIALAHSLQLKVIAEGVETKEQLAFLCAHDCDYVQGYIYSPAITATEIHNWLRPSLPMHKLADP